MRQRSCKSASLSSLFHPPSRANFKGTKKSFCIGGEKDSFESLTRNHPSSVGTTWLKKAAEARGNSHESTQSLLRLSGPVLQGHGARPVGSWANGHRRGVPAYVVAAPLAPGGVSGRLGAKWRGVVPRPWRTTRPACVTDATSQAEAMEQRTVVRGHVTPRRADDMEVLR